VICPRLSLLTLEHATVLSMLSTSELFYCVCILEWWFSGKHDEKQEVPLKYQVSCILTSRPFVALQSHDFLGNAYNLFIFRCTWTVSDDKIRQHELQEQPRKGVCAIILLCNGRR
jgi:hypothetical protein